MLAPQLSHFMTPRRLLAAALAATRLGGQALRHAGLPALVVGGVARLAAAAALAAAVLGRALAAAGILGPGRRLGRAVATHRPPHHLGRDLEIGRLDAAGI